MPLLTRCFRCLPLAVLLLAVSCSRTEGPRPETAQAEPITESTSFEHSSRKHGEDHGNPHQTTAGKLEGTHHPKHHHDADKHGDDHHHTADGNYGKDHHHPHHAAAGKHKATHQPKHDKAAAHDQRKNEATPLSHNENKSASLGENASTLAIFEKRILPIFQSPKPSSCTECHLSGVDLKDYIQADQQKTFGSLVNAGLIDVKKPLNSKILEFIQRKPEKPNLITDKVREQEYEAFQAWIMAAVDDPKLLAAKSEQPIGPQIPDEVIRHARKDRVLASFLDNIWTEVGRCAACHSPDQNQKQVKENGEQVSWIKLNDPEATMRYLVEKGLIDSKNPEESLLLMKPTLQVDHGGGQKMVVGDRTYKQFRRFIDDYAAIAQGKYTKSEQLPEPSDEVSGVTDIWLKIEGVPAKYDKMLLQVDLYRKTESGWTEFRVATSDRPVFGPKNLWQHSLSLTAPRGTKWANAIQEKRLPPGRYLAKLYVDQTGELQKDFTAQLSEKDFVGQLEVESRLRAGYGRMTVVKFPIE